MEDMHLQTKLKGRVERGNRLRRIGDNQSDQVVFFKAKRMVITGNPMDYCKEIGIRIDLVLIVDSVVVTPPSADIEEVLVYRFAAIDLHEKPQNILNPIGRKIAKRISSQKG